MKKTITNRGFVAIEFVDRNGEKCSLQESSIATENAIWLGCDEANPQVLIPGKGWTKLECPPDTLFNTRMHLTQEQVKKLLPFLEKFVKKGTI
jgi:hypothetical protein